MKSFSVLTKEELCKAESSANDDVQAELAGMILFGSTVTDDSVRFTTENSDVLGRYRKLCKSVGIDEGEIVSAPGATRYTVVTKIEYRLAEILKAFEVEDPVTGVLRYGISLSVKEDAESRRSFIKGAFLGGGTIIDPAKNYNLEIVAPYKGLSRDFSEVQKKAGFVFRIVMRKSKYVLYVKNSETIIDFLAYTGAYQAQMKIINIKIQKEVNNSFIRTVNGETANIEKTINAAVRQAKAIDIIEKTIGIDELPDDLKEIALLRLEHKSESLVKLGQMLDPPLGKSGVNHRFKRIIAIADRLSEDSEE